MFEPLLTKYPEVEAVFDYNDESAMGVSAALLAGGKKIATVENPEGVIVTGSNGDQDAIEAVEEGRLSWTWDPDNLASGFAAVKQMNAALSGEKPKDLIVESILVDGETISEYIARRRTGIHAGRNSGERSHGRTETGELVDPCGAA